MEPSKRGPRKEEDDIMAVNPRAINVAEFAAARASELKTMTEAVMTMGGMRRTFQTLPRHMRRRAMSHNLKRLPKRLRDSEERAMLRSANKRKSAPSKEGGDEEPIPVKRSRRHRRRPGNLRQEYQRRQANHAWLETHIWHAKRFKMVEAWGQRLPLHPSERGVRAAYRATARHCIIQDISYFQVIEICGPQAMILQALSHVTSPTTGLTCGAASFITGQRHGETVFYQNDRFPEGAIGAVNFLWKAELKCPAPETKEGAKMLSSSCEDDSGGAKIRQLWLWAHPSCLDLLLTELERACLKVNSDREFTGSIVVRKLEQSPLRFRLQGPLSHPVLLDALKMADVSQEGLPRLWWQDYYAGPNNMQAFSEQSATWQSLHGNLLTTDIPPRSVLALTVRDPRNLLPIKRTKIKAEPDKVDQTDQLPVTITHGFPAAVSVSPIFEESVRQSVTSTQMSIHELNKLRSELLVPGHELSLGQRESRVPVLLLQQPGSESIVAGKLTTAKESCPSGFGSGWDVVVPSGWGMAFWIALVFRGARATGLQQSRSCHLQQGMLHFPEAFPDTKAGKEWEDRIDQELTDKFRRWPPAKRPNYGKLGVVSPFRCPWTKLLQEWKDAKTRNVQVKEENSKDDPTSGTDSVGKPSLEVQSFFCLRERCKLEALTKALAFSKKRPKEAKLAKGLNQIGSSDAKASAADKIIKDEVMEASNGHAVQVMVSSKESITDHQREIASDVSFIPEMFAGAERTLVGVKLRMVNRGVPEPFAMVCIPSDEDVSAFKSNSKYCPIEPIHTEFKLLRPSKPKKKKKKKDKSADKNPRELVQDRASSVKFEVAPQRDLFDSCTRKVIGFVCDGANVFVSGSGQAVGYCCMLGLLHLIKERPKELRSLVLIRNTNSVQYRFAYLDVIC